MSVDSVLTWTLKSPLGDMLALADDNFLYLLQFADYKYLEKKIKQICSKLNCNIVEGKNKLLSNLQDEINQYFDGNLKEFTIPMRTFGSDFQKSVWKELRGVEYGATRTYGDVARRLGRGSAHARALGAACGANALLLLVPCHRVVGGGGGAGGGGYSAGGDRKSRLIEHERKHSGTE